MQSQSPPTTLGSNQDNNNTNNSIQQHSHKRLNLILGNQKVKRIKQLTILLVGVGGIGCQVLKNISKLPIKQITIIDLDTIQTSNLNRQFYFHTQHLGRPKAIVASQEIKKLLLGQINVQPIFGSIYDHEYNNYRFFQQFDIVISALDNLKAREFLAKKCTEYGKVMIDAGTAGYHGQSYTSMRFLTSCHNCYNVDRINDNEKNGYSNVAVCTIRSRPQKTVHCAIYAKYIFERIFSIPFSDNSNGDKHDMNNNSSLERLTRIRQRLDQHNLSLEQQKQSSSQQTIKRIGIELFDYLFCGQFQHLLQYDDNGYQEKEKYEQYNNKTTKTKINLLRYKDVVAYDVNQNDEQDNDNDTLNRDNNVLTIKQYTQLFIQSFIKLVVDIKKHNTTQKYISYDKDNLYCNLFIATVTNLRVYNFLINEQKQIGLKYCTVQDVRRIVGKIVPAIASTNSIAAALEVKQLLQLLSFKQRQQNSMLISLKNTNQLKYYTISPFTHQKLSHSWLSLPNPQCPICSPLNLYYHISCNFTSTTFSQLQEFTNQKCFSYHRDLYCGNLIIVKNINTKKESVNKKKLLNFKPQLIVNGTLTVEYFPVGKLTDLRVKIVLVNQQEQKEKEEGRRQNDNNYIRQKFIILNEYQIQQTLDALQIFRQKQKHRQQQQYQQQQQQDSQPFIEIE